MFTPTRFDTSGHDLPALRRIDGRAPSRWLEAGWQDLRRTPIASLAYGLLFALGGDLIILALLEHPYLVALSVSGFFFVAPLLAAGLYELSRSSARGEHLTFIDSLRVFRRNVQSLALFGLLLALVAALWERVSAVAFALLGAGTAQGASVYLSELLFSGEHALFTLTWLGLGAVLAAFVYCLTVVSVPMMVDRGCDPVTAMATSLRAVATNPGPLALWAVLIALLTLTGFATLLFGLVVLMPMLGHASWHAYRELVE